MAIDPRAPRSARRRVQTRTALLRAGQRLLAEGRTNVAVLEITEIADVGLGTFYNHFESKEDFFRDAADDALERHGALMDELTAEIADPAVAFAQSVRLTGRLHRMDPELSRVILAHGTELIHSDKGLAPRALRDIRTGIAAGRFDVDDPELALSTTAGAVLALGSLLHAQPSRDDAASADRLAFQLLRLFGVSETEAAEICALPLPPLPPTSFRQAAGGKTGATTDVTTEGAVR